MIKKRIMLEDYDYTLPEELISQKATIPRDACSFMVLDSDIIKRKKFKDLCSFLRKGDVLVMNDTKVSESKAYGKKITGSPAEIIFTKKLSLSEYECHVKTKNPRPGTIIELEGGIAKIFGQKNIDTYIVSITGRPKMYLPGPPYIHKRMTREYQTVFAKKLGSLAAPTAGLHFTTQLLKKIKQKGVKIVYITLHVGYGTFRNIEDIKNFKMEEERYEISKDAAKTINSRKGKLFVVGTTTLKALESSSENGKIISANKASKLFITPGHKFSSGTDALITNFHLPKSTLLLLTCAFGGKERIMNAYNLAVKEKYRFYSLGDAMIVFRRK